jgi:hypothetical protein
MMVFNRPEMAYAGTDWKLLETWLAIELMDTHKRLTNFKTTIEEIRMLQGRASLLAQMLQWPELPAAGKPQNPRS